MPPAKKSAKKATKKDSPKEKVKSTTSSSKKVSFRDSCDPSDPSPFLFCFGVILTNNSTFFSLFFSLFFLSLEDTSKERHKG